MRFWVALALVSLTACSGMLGKEYEYEEDVTLALDGSAIVNINASILSLVALRGLDLDANPRARFDDAFVANVRRQAEALGCSVERVSSTAWYRHNRRFIQIRITVPDIRAAAKCGLLSWSKYAFEDTGAGISLRQDVGAAAGKDVTAANWDGSEMVAFKLHLPSKITFHNMRDIETGKTATALRGNILLWEQRLADRRAGKPLTLEMRMDRESILKRTLLLFAAAFAAALVVMGGAIWWTLKRPRRSA
ncbi:MAG: hypothetical protein EPO35_11035 [Acidobacteria bacterium]|nr:MAG: hypothetical protein EPO35_11035 [Acidobacteriota bacterium]